MNESSKTSLPDEVQALFFVCDCFALGEQELSEYRMKLNRARAGTSISQNERERIRIQLFHRMCKAIQTPVSHATFVTDELVARLLEVYAKVRPLLRNSQNSSLDVAWVLAEHVLVPTAHLIIRKKHRCGLGTELIGDHAIRLQRCKNGSFEPAFAMHENALVLLQVAQFVGFDFVLFDAGVCPRGYPNRRKAMETGEVVWRGHPHRTVSAGINSRLNRAWVAVFLTAEALFPAHSPFD